MVTPTYTVECLANDLVATDIYEIRFSKPEGFTFKPGQFVMFQVPLMDDPADIQTRSLSIASTPDELDLLFIVKMLPGGRASRWIQEVLKPGSKITMLGPLGLFVMKPEDTRDRVCIATSTGVGPLRSQIRSALASGDTRRMDLIFGVRNEEDLFWQDEFEKLTQQYENFFLHIALSNPSPAWTGHKGRVQTLVPLIIKDLSERSLSICGSPDMTRELKQLCLEQWNVSKEQLHIEGYI